MLDEARGERGERSRTRSRVISLLQPFSVSLSGGGGEGGEGKEGGKKGDNKAVLPPPPPPLARSGGHTQRRPTSRGFDAGLAPRRGTKIAVHGSEPAQDFGQAGYQDKDAGAECLGRLTRDATRAGVSGGLATTTPAPGIPPRVSLSLSLTTPVTTRLSRSPSPSLPYPFLLSLLLSFSLSPSPPLPPQLTPPLWSPLRLARYAYRHAHRTAHPCYLVFCCPVHCLLFLSFSTSTLASSATFHHVFFLLFTLTDSLLACGFNSKRVVIPANYNNKPMCTF